MSNCGDKNTWLLSSVNIPIPGIKDVDMVLGELSASTVSTNRNYAAFQLSLERGKNLDVAQAGQTAIYYIGGICCLLPEVTDDVLEGFRLKGGRVRIVRVPESDDVAMPHQNKANALFGWLVTMLYKNTNEDISNMVSDPDFKAPFDAAGFDPRGEGEDKVLSLFSHPKHVLCYWGYGQLGRIKESILKGFYNVYKTLVLSDSPVLKFHGLAHEIENLHRAINVPNAYCCFRAYYENSRNQFSDAFKAHVMQFLNDRRQSDED
ncbi:hypothetical protein Bca4012_022668 [Brassica carinata]